jgi:hypothetical protein
MRSLKVLMIFFWVVLVTITVLAVQSLGSEGGMVFITDFSHPWRAQFNADFLMHIFLFCTWVFYREESKVIGVIAALFSLMGGLFTFIYLAFAIHRANGDPRKFLLGTHA